MDSKSNPNHLWNNYLFVFLLSEKGKANIQHNKHKFGMSEQNKKLDLAKPDYFVLPKDNYNDIL
jgi:hypothetical protein